MKYFDRWSKLEIVSYGQQLRIMKMVDSSFKIGVEIQRLENVQWRSSLSLSLSPALLLILPLD